MKMNIAFLQQLIAAKTGKLILRIYNWHTAVFIRKDDLVLPELPIQQREIILIRKTGHTYKAVANAVVLS